MAKVPTHGAFIHAISMVDGAPVLRAERCYQDVPSGGVRVYRRAYPGSWSLIQTGADRERLRPELRSMSAQERADHFIAECGNRGVSWLPGQALRGTKKVPSMGTIRKWVYDSVAAATDGCRVEPDGICQHGSRSWLLVLGMI